MALEKVFFDPRTPKRLRQGPLKGEAYAKVARQKKIKKKIIPTERIGFIGLIGSQQT